jgi:predicted enzyme related to lactoylglutathione lyase
MYHTIIHFEIPAEDVERLRKFYSQLFGWKIEKTEGMDYWLIQTVPVDEQGRPKAQGVNGGMMKKQSPEHMFTYYVLVESVDEYCKKIEELGGKVIVQKMEVPNMGWWAMAIDPEGNHFAIWEEMQK